ncbi:hypothetical protein [Tenacibaculum sp. C7A-26P2]|uniref:hypothetical protein n=1 Tax=Tenacibaculum sp. C7A-26P2 TaxID=3447504 RepID=UPI003F831BE8
MINSKNSLDDKINEIKNKLEGCSKAILSIQKYLNDENKNFLEKVIPEMKRNLSLKIDDGILSNWILEKVSYQLGRIKTDLMKLASSSSEYLIKQDISGIKERLIGVLKNLGNLPISLNEGNLDFQKITSDTEKSCQDILKVFEKKNEKSLKEVDHLEKKILEAQETISNLEKNLEQKEKEVNEVNFRLGEFKLILDKKGDTVFSEIKKNEEKRFTEFFEKTKYNANELKEGIEHDALIYVKDIQGEYEKAKQIVGLLANDSVTGNYKNEADRHRKIANNFRCLAIIIMSLSSFIVAYIILTSNNIDWTKSLIRLLGVAILSYPVSYSIRESNKHRKLEVFNRNAELELTALDPFIESLNETEKLSIKKTLAEKYFGNGSNFLFDSCNKNKEGVSLNMLEKMVKMIEPLLKK